MLRSIPGYHYRTSVRAFHKQSVNEARRTRIYQNAILDDCDSVEGAVNKGFAYLSVDKGLFASKALECFYKAQEYDRKKRYKEIIDRGITYAKSRNDCEEFHHVAFPVHAKGKLKVNN